MSLIEKQTTTTYQNGYWITALSQKNIWRKQASCKNYFVQISTSLQLESYLSISPISCHRQMTSFTIAYSQVLKYSVLLSSFYHNKQSFSSFWSFSCVYLTPSLFPCTLLTQSQSVFIASQQASPSTVRHQLPFLFTLLLLLCIMIIASSSSCSLLC